MVLQAGFVGCGNITDTHGRAAREAGLGIAAFFGRDPAKAKALAAVGKNAEAGQAYAKADEYQKQAIDLRKAQAAKAKSG